MNIHEYQAKELLSRYHIPVPKGKAVATSEEAGAWAGELIAPPYVVKAQIHAGGRGKAGGVKLTKEVKQVKELADDLLGKTLVTHQTGPEGRVVNRVLIEEGVSIQKEFYLSLLIDRTTGYPVLIASSEGGVEIEEVSEKNPEKILKVLVDPAVGFQAFQGRTLAFQLGLPKEAIGSFVKVLGQLYRLYTEKGASVVEINPLVLTGDLKIVALDAKISFDDSSLFQHQDILAFRDLEEEDPLEIRASQFGLNYVKLNGNIGCMVNGAGLAMATMDVIKLAGAEPANFLDVGGGASQETVKHAFQILLSDPNVKGVLVNIFGGIVRCERIAGGIVEAAKEIELKVPLVVRLEGTHAKEGKELLAQSGLGLHVVSDLWEGAQKIVKLLGS